MQVNNAIRWSGVDTQGSFSHTGLIVALKPAKNAKHPTVVLKTAEGLFEIPTNDGSFSVIDPSEVVSVKLEPFVEQVAEVETPKAGSVKTKEGSKQHRAVELLRGQQDLKRKEAIALLVAELTISEACASTYVANARRILQAG